MAPQQSRVARPSPDLTTLSHVTDDTIVTRLRERVSINAPWSKVGNSLFLYVNRFNGEADQFPVENEAEGEPGLEEITSRVTRCMSLEGNNDQSIILLYFPATKRTCLANLRIVVSQGPGKVFPERIFRRVYWSLTALLQNKQNKLNFSSVLSSPPKQSPPLSPLAWEPNSQYNTPMQTTHTPLSE